MNENALQKIFDKTQGHCHFCGDPVTFSRRGWRKNLNGRWEVDHVIQRHKGGAKSSDNCLPACTRCNRLRWHRTGENIRQVLFLGVLAQQEIAADTKLGKLFRTLLSKRLSENKLRRKKRALLNVGIDSMHTSKRRER
jgi:HNH endonuclease